MKERLTELLCLKSLITMAVVGTFCYLTIQGRISEDNFQTIMAVVITYYFTRQTKYKKGE
jgi:hypothetical protein